MGGGGGAWKVAYADFVTAMMAFFMVMWLTSQSQDVKSAIAEHFKSPGGKRLSGMDAKSLVPSSSNGNGSRRAIKAKGSKKSDGEAKHREMTDEGERSNVGTIVPFALNSFELGWDGRDALLTLIPELKGKQHRIEVRGHSANNGGNVNQAALDAWSIAFRRAMAVSQFLIDNGIDPRRIRASSAGNSEPKFKEDRVDPDSDSRVEVFVLTEIFEDPSSITERLVSNKSLDGLAADMEANAKAAVADAPKYGGGH